MKDKILEIMKETFEVENIDETCSQENCENWDSLHHLNLVVELEGEFGFSFEPEEIAEMKSFGDVLRFIKEKML